MVYTVSTEKSTASIGGSIAFFCVWMVAGGVLKANGAASEVAFALAPGRDLSEGGGIIPNVRIIVAASRCRQELRCDWTGV